MSSNLASSKRANVYGKARHIFARKCLSYLFRPGFHYAGLAFAIQALEYRSPIRQNSRECQVSGPSFSSAMASARRLISSAPP